MGAQMEAPSPIPAVQLHHLALPFKIRPEEGNGTPPPKAGKDFTLTDSRSQNCNSPLFFSLLELNYPPILLRGRDFILVSPQDQV